MFRYQLWFAMASFVLDLDTLHVNSAGEPELRGHGR